MAETAELIELESVRRLDIHPGETLVATLKGPVSMAMADQVKHRMLEYLPEGVHVLIVSDDIGLSVIAGPDAAEQGQNR